MKILTKIWHTWKQVGQFMGDFIARIVLTIFYFTFFLPFGLTVRLFSDPLAIKQPQQSAIFNDTSGWVERTTTDLTIENARRLA
jgi:hypothetical protein